ncbi:MAG TPA: STAS domain-containing protein [Streptomyces sp.]|nr:STAS domain-containing protein [Streptomyces sp.]
MADHEESRMPRPDARSPRSKTAALVLASDGPVTRADIPRLCERLCRLPHGSRAGPVTVDIGEFATADLVTVEALARLWLTAHRLGRRIRLRRAGGDLRRLLAWTGMAEVLLAADEDPDAAQGEDPDALPVPVPGTEPAASAGAERGGQCEQREQPGSVQESVDPADPPP